MLSARSLVYFLSTLQTGSLTTTARTFGVSVPTVSASIAQMESTLGSQLFLRTPGGLLPTQAAEAAQRALRALLTGLAGIAAPDSPARDLPSLHDLPVSLLLVSRFVAVFEAGSIGGAATRLRVTQPQISRQVGELEVLLDTRLFDRHPHGVTPTWAAQALYDRARPLCDVAVGLIGRGNRLFSEGQQATRIGSVPPFHPESRLAGLLAALCARWEATLPGAPLTVLTDTTDRLFAALAGGSIHAVIVEADAIPASCESHDLQQTALDLIIGTDTALASPRHILTTLPLALQSRASGLRRLADDWMERAGIRPARIVEVDAMPVIGRLVREHGYCSLVPEGSIPLPGAQLHRIALPDPPVLSQRLVWRRDQAGTRQVRRLREMVTQLGAS